MGLAMRLLSSAVRRRALGLALNIVLSALAAGFLAGFVLGELLGVDGAPRVIAWCVVFAAFLAVDLGSGGDDRR
jgi:hypothetical protein